MTREEFEGQLSKMHPYCDFRLPTDAEYGLIEHVYMHHPSISDHATVGKTQMAWLYTNFGMAIIKDMEPRAAEMENLYRQLNAAKKCTEEILDRIREVKRGGGIGYICTKK